MTEFATFEDFSKEIQHAISLAHERNFPLRVLGGAAIRMHCPNHADLYERLKRTPKHAMDFVTYSRNRAHTRRLVVDLGYVPYVTMMMTGATGRRRQIFND